MRVLHFTDLHLFQRPGLGALWGKRLLGASNLYLARRVDHFSERSVEALVRAVLELAPDLCVCTGDLTAMASPAEFVAARRVLEPILQGFPFFVVPGNHDVYTRGSKRERRFEHHFGTWSGGGEYPAVHRHGDISIVGLDCCDPHPVLATGRLPERQVRDLAALLASGELEDSYTILLLHYPLRHADGRPHGPKTRSLVNASDLEAVLARHPGVDLVLHGHEHHGYRSELQTPHGPIPIIDPGAGGRACSTARNETAHLAVYTIEDRRLAKLERWALDGERFVPEPGGAFASGR